MSVTLSIQFTGGQYHATPWGTYVNEGQVEWPPSPWRLLRALISVGFCKRDWNTVIPEEYRQLLYALAEAQPSYWLPNHYKTATRHYMAIAKSATTKIVDAFIRVDSQEHLFVQWPVSLSMAQRLLLQDLVKGLAYLGRAESWVEAELLSEDAEQKLISTAPNCWVNDGSTACVSATEVVELLAPVTAAEYDQWRAEAIAAEPAKVAKNAKKLRELYPESLGESLCCETSVLQRNCWSYPPGSQWVSYVVSPAVVKTFKAKSAAVVEPAQAVLISLTSETVRGNVLPRITQAVPEMEALHSALVATMGTEVPPVITGCDATSGKRLANGHKHAHYMPLDLDGDRHIDHVLIYAVEGEFDSQVMSAMYSLRKRGYRNIASLYRTVVGSGSLDWFRNTLKTKSGARVAEVGRSRVWESVTPFVAARHLHATGRNSLEDQIRLECAWRGLPEPVSVKVLNSDNSSSSGPMSEQAREFFWFVCKRSKARRQPPTQRRYALRIEFAEEVEGPLSLGYASHFGLGQFAAR